MCVGDKDVSDSMWKVISQIKELRMYNLSLAKLIVIKVLSQWIFTLLELKLTHKSLLINVSIDTKLQSNFSTCNMLIKCIDVLLLSVALMMMLS